MNVQMPDGTIITDVPENITQKELLARYNKFTAPKIETAGIGEALKGGAKRMLGSLETAITSPFGAEEAAKQGLARQEAITEKPGASLEKVKQVYGEKGFLPAAREVVSQVPGAIAEQFPNLAATIGSARLGAMAGSTFGPAGAVVGGIGGAFVPSLVQQTGSNLERQAQEGAPISGSGALAAAVPQAALDVFTDRLLFSRLMGVPAKTLGRADADAVVAKSIKRTLAEGTAKGVVAEVPTEVAQQMLERYQAGLSLTDEEARKEYADTAYQVALLGPLGAVGKLQERGEARGVIAQDVAAQQAAAQQAQRQATGVMEQQPLFAPQEMPIPEPTLTPAPISTIAPEEAVAEEPVPEGQGELFTMKGAPTKEAKASVEAARLQGLPAQIAELNQTPEGRAQLAGDMKTYFPDLSVQERNRLRPQIQAGTYGVEPVAPVEGTLTPEVLQSFDITPRSKQYKALAGASLADPTTYNLLTTAAATNTDFGVKANRILDAFPHYNPAAVQPDLFGAPYAPQTETQAEPVQPDLFGVPAVGTPPVEPGAEQGMGQPVQQQGAAPAQAEEPVGGGVAVPSGAPDGNLGQPAASADVQPSALAPVPPRVAKQAAAALKKEPITQAWGYMSDTPYAKLSKVSKDRVKGAHAQGYLTQELADDIERIEAANTRATAASAAIKPEAELDEDKVALDKALSTLDAGLQQFANTKLNVMPEDKVSVGDMLNALGEVMYLLVKRGVKSLNEAMRLAKKELGPNADMLSDEQYKQAYIDAEAKYKAETKPAKAEPTGLDANAQAQAQQAIASMSGMFAQSNPQPVLTGAQVAANIGNLVRDNPSGAIEMMERKINAFRNKVVWRGATLADDIQRANDNAFRDAYGNVRADILMSQAENTQNITESVFTFGGVEITPDGSVHAKVADHSIDGVFRNAKTLADRIGADTARELITKTFYAWRAKALLTLPKNEWPINWQQNPSLIPTQAQINAGMAAFNQFPELQAMKTEFIGAKNEAVKFLRQADFLTEEKAKAFLADDSYAPWFRLKEYDDTLPGLGNMGRMVDLKQMQALKGGSEEVNDMLENMAQVVSWFVRSGVSNHTANRALNTMQEMGTATPQRSRPTGTNPDNIVMTYVDGKRMFWTVSDPLQLQAFQSVKAINSPVIKAMSKGLGTLRAGIVLFPAFPVRQVIMDTYRAYAQSGVEQPAKLVGKVFKSFLSGEAYKAMSDDILEMKKYGVVGSADFNLSDSTRGRAEAYGLQGPEKGITATWLRSPVYKALHNFAYSADLAVRLGIYRQTMEETGDKELAIARAREIINFQKSGNSELMLTLKQLIPFMGAYLQGTDVNYRSMIGRGNSMKSRKAAASAFWGNMATLAALTVAYTMSMSGDDEYEEQKGFITDRNFIIPGVGLLPVPPDIGFLSKVIPERITDYILQEGTDNPESVSRLVDGIRGAAGAAYLPPAAVYGITPAIELALNKSFFTDIPIVGQYMQGLEPFQQYTSSTSELAKTAGGIANMSPMQIDYLLKAIGGTAGGALIQMFDVFASDGKIAREKNAILGTFQKKEVGGRYTEEFYETRELIERTYNTVKALDELGDQAAVDAYLSRPEIQQRMGARPMIEQMNTMLQEVRKARAGIENDPALTPDEKRQAVNELQAGVERALKEAGIRKVRSEIE